MIGIALLLSSLPRPADFSSHLSWNDAYQLSADEADWLIGYDTGLKETLLARLPEGGRLLELGCGTSSLAVQLHATGKYAVLATDASSVAIDIQRQRHHSKLCPTLSFEVADARNTKLKTSNFAAIVDKGTLDALLCGDGFDYEAACLSGECARLLRSGGSWVSISLSPPRTILPLLARDEWYSLSATPLAGSVFCYAAVRR